MQRPCVCRVEQSRHDELARCVHRPSDARGCASLLRRRAGPTLVGPIAAASNRWGVVGCGQGFGGTGYFYSTEIPANFVVGDKNWADCVSACYGTRKLFYTYLRWCGYNCWHTFSPLRFARAVLSLPLAHRKFRFCCASFRLSSPLLVLTDSPGCLRWL